MMAELAQCWCAKEESMHHHIVSTNWRNLKDIPIQKNKTWYISPSREKKNLRSKYAKEQVWWRVRYESCDES